MAAAKDYQSYLKNKCIVGYGIVNGIVNALIFMGMHAGDADITFAAGKVVEEIALTGALLGLILTWCVVPLTKMDFNKGVYPGNSEGYGWLAKLPKKSIPLSIVVGIIALVVATPLAWLCTFVLPLPLSRTGMMIFKGVMCAVAGCVSGYVVIGATTAGVDAGGSRRDCLGFSNNQTFSSKRSARAKGSAVLLFTRKSRCPLGLPSELPYLRQWL